MSDTGIQNVPIEIVWSFVPGYRDCVSLALTCKMFAALLEDDIRVERLQYEYKQRLELERFSIVRRGHILDSMSIKSIGRYIIALESRRSVMVVLNSSIYNTLIRKGYIDASHLLITAELIFEDNCRDEVSLSDGFIVKSSESGLLNPYSAVEDAMGVRIWHDLTMEIRLDTSATSVSCILAKLSEESMEETYFDSGWHSIYRTVIFSFLCKKGFDGNISASIESFSLGVQRAIAGTSYSLPSKPDVVF